MRTVHRKPALNRNHTITFKQSDCNASRAYGQIWNVPSWHVPKVRGTSAKARRADLYLFRPRLHFDLLADLQPSPKLGPQPGFEGNGIMTHAIRFAIRFHETGGPEVLVWEKVDVGEPGAGEARIRHTAIGLNYVDTYVRSGAYPSSLPT